jgi:hypothetical protein
LLEITSHVQIYIKKEFVQPKMSLNNREFPIRKERGRGRKRERGKWAGGQLSRQAYLR